MHCANRTARIYAEISNLCIQKQHEQRHLNSVGQSTGSRYKQNAYVRKPQIQDKLFLLYEAVYIGL